MERVKQEIEKRSRQPQDAPVEPTHMRVRSTANSLKVGCGANWDSVAHLSALDGTTVTQYMTGVLADSEQSKEKTTRVIDIGATTDGLDVAEIICTSIVPDEGATATDVLNLRFALDAATIVGLPIKGGGVLVKQMSERINDKHRRELHKKANQLSDAHDSGHYIDKRLELEPLKLNDIGDPSLSSLDDLQTLICNMHQALLFETIRDVRAAEPAKRLLVSEGMFSTPLEAKIAADVIQGKFGIQAVVVKDYDDCEDPGTIIYVPMESRAIQMLDNYYTGRRDAALPEGKKVIFAATDKVLIDGINSTVEFGVEGLTSEGNQETLKFTDTVVAADDGGACRSLFPQFLPNIVSLQFTWSPETNGRSISERGDTPNDGYMPISEDEREANREASRVSPLLYPRIPATAPSATTSVADDLINESLTTIQERPQDERYCNLLDRVTAPARTQRAEPQSEWERYKPSSPFAPVPIQPTVHESPVDLDRLAEYPLSSFSPTVASAVRGLRNMPADYLVLEEAVQVMFDGKPSAKIIMGRYGRARKFCEQNRSVVTQTDQKTLRTRTSNGVPIGMLFTMIYDIVSRKTTSPEPFHRLVLCCKLLQSFNSMFSVEGPNVFSNS